MSRQVRVWHSHGYLLNFAFSACLQGAIINKKRNSVNWLFNNEDMFKNSSS